MKRQLINFKLLIAFVSNVQISRALANNYLELELNLIDGNYYTTLEIGSNKDNVKVLIDTGSADLWVPSIDNFNCINKEEINLIILEDSTEINFSIYGIFDYETSKTLKWNNSDFEMEYIDGSNSSGWWAQDEMYINNESIGYINFGIANESSNEFGTLGLGLSKLEETNFLTDNKSYIYENFPLKLKNNNIIKSSSYSIFSGNNTYGSLLFGAIDHNKYLNNTLYKFPIVNAYLASGINDIRSISITMNSVSLIEGEEIIKLLNGYFAVIIDSGTQTAVLPYSLVEDLKKLLNLNYEKSTDIWYTKCNLLNERLFSFNFQGVEYYIPISNFFLKINGDSGICGLAVKSTLISEYLVLGQSFLNNIYMVVDMENYTIGLGIIDETSNDKDIEVIITDGIPNAKEAPWTQTYDTFHMLHSSLTTSKSKIATSVDYNTVYFKSIRQVGSVDTITTSYPSEFSYTVKSSFSASSISISISSHSVSSLSIGINSNNGLSQFQTTTIASSILVVFLLLLCV